MRLTTIVLATLIVAANAAYAEPIKTPDAVRAQQIKDMKWGMFICWSFSTFSGHEWTPTQDKDASYFRATDADTDQWCQTAKEAGMGYILFLTKHHDGFCLWDTATTEKKATNSPLGIDVLKKLRKSCDKYGIKLALYFSEGDWNWPGAQDGKGGASGGGSNPDVKKAQLKELCTQYGPIEFFWMDHAVGNGGLSHAETVKWVHTFQPDCFVGFNHGTPAGRICLRERGKPGKLGDTSASGFNKRAEESYKGYLVAEFTYPIQPAHKGGAMWFYSLPKYDGLCLPAEKLYRDYLGAVKNGNIFSIDVGPNYTGKLREIDVKRLRKVGQYIRGQCTLPPPPISQGKPAQASSQWNESFAPSQAFDGDPNTRWGAAPQSRTGWLSVDLGKPTAVDHAVVDEANWDRVQRFELQVEMDGQWTTIASGTTIGPLKMLHFKRVVGRQFRLNILKANEVPTIVEFELHAATDKSKLRTVSKTQGSRTAGIHRAKGGYCATIFKDR